MGLQHSQGTCLAGCPEREGAVLRYSVRAAGLATGATLPLLLETGTVPQTESHLGMSAEGERMFEGSTDTHKYVHNLP